MCEFEELRLSSVVTVSHQKETRDCQAHSAKEPGGNVKPEIDAIDLDPPKGRPVPHYKRKFVCATEHVETDIAHLYSISWL